jgi:hypothetical protein
MKGNLGEVALRDEEVLPSALEVIPTCSIRHHRKAFNTKVISITYFAKKHRFPNHYTSSRCDRDNFVIQQVNSSPHTSG